MFSTLTLTGESLPTSIQLSAAEDYPGLRHDCITANDEHRPGWVATTPPSTGHVTLKLGERLGSGGRAGVSYSVEVVNASSSVGGLLDGLDLCVKIARPNRCRTFAREAWAYSQLGQRGLQGVVVPRFFGFFTADLSRDNVTFPPWTEEDFWLQLGWDDVPDNPELDDPLRDDFTVDDGLSGERDYSPWKSWRPDPEHPCLALIVMTRGGKEYCLSKDRDVAEIQQDMHAIIEDLSRAFVIHGDMKPNNIVRAPADTQRHRISEHAGQEPSAEDDHNSQFAM